MEKLREFKCRVLISTDLVMMTYPTCTMSSHLHCLCNKIYIFLIHYLITFVTNLVSRFSLLAVGTCRREPWERDCFITAVLVRLYSGVRREARDREKIRKKRGTGCFSFSFSRLCAIPTINLNA